MLEAAPKKRATFEEALMSGGLGVETGTKEAVPVTGRSRGDRWLLTGNVLSWIMIYG
jgi:hypothetical protein